MGKYYYNKTNNNKTTSDVTHGVRTRARTLALRSFDSSFLQLRSRCLVKKFQPPVQLKQTDHQILPRRTRESTPSNLAMAADDLTPLGSTTKQTSPTQNAQNSLMAREMEEFFTQAEHSQQQLFIHKYNFDIVHDKPLSGRYEWVKIIP